MVHRCCSMMLNTNQILRLVDQTSMNRNAAQLRLTVPRYTIVQSPRRPRNNIQKALLGKSFGLPFYSRGFKQSWSSSFNSFCPHLSLRVSHIQHILFAVASSSPTSSLLPIHFAKRKKILQTGSVTINICKSLHYRRLVRFVL